MDLKNEKFKKIILKGVIVIVSTYIMSFSYALYLKANLGSDSVSLLVHGISNTFNVQYGTSSNFVNIVLFIIILIFNKKVIGFSTVISTFCTGTFLQININFLNSLNSGEEFALWVNLALPIIASVINAIGIGSYLTMNLGASPFDGTVLAIKKNEKFSYKSAMYSINILFFITGILLGGTWGYGTLVAVGLSGFLFEKMLKIMGNVFAHIIKEGE